MRGVSRAWSSGFTLIEIIIVIAIFGALLALGLFMSMDAYRGFSFRSERSTIVSLLQKARSRAMNNSNQTPWGVCYQSGNYVIFQGLACTTGETIPAGPAATTTGLLAGVVFSQLSGTTTAATITVLQDGRSSTISTNNEGTIIW
jgi:prepilin-type N-terminal cleavage/methylation domain-containing protein